MTSDPSPGSRKQSSDNPNFMTDGSKDVSLFKLSERTGSQGNYNFICRHSNHLIHIDRNIAKFGNCSAYKWKLGLLWELVCSYNLNSYKSF